MPESNLNNVVPYKYNGDGKLKSKNEITNDVISDLEKEIEKLKYKRDYHQGVKKFLN